MDNSTILQALSHELKTYTSLTVEYRERHGDLVENLFVRRVGCKQPMVVRCYNGVISCAVYINGVNQKDKGGRIELADPQLVDKLLAIFKRDLR